MEKWEIRPPQAPLPQKPLNRSSPKFARVITSGPLLLCKILSRYDYPPLPQICENAHQVTRLVLFFIFWFFRQPTAKTPAPIFTINTSNDAVSRKDVPFGGPENKMLHFDPIPPQKKTAKFWPIFDGTKFRVKKALTMGMLACKLPLIVIVAQ